MPPRCATEIVEKALRSAPLIDCATEPAPQVIVSGFQAAYIEFGVYAWLLRPGRENTSISSVLTRVYYALERSGIQMDAVVQTVELLRKDSAPGDAGAAIAEQVEMLRRVEILRSCEPDELALLAQGLRRQAFAPGEVILHQNEAGDSLYFLARGRVTVNISHGSELSEVLATLNPGDFFGEMSLMTGEPRSATVTAVTPVDCRILTKPAMQELLLRRPQLMEDITRVLALRQEGLARAHSRLESEEQRRARAEHEAGLMTSIQKFFGILENWD